MDSERNRNHLASSEDQRWPGLEHAEFETDERPIEAAYDEKPRGLRTLLIIVGLAVFGGLAWTFIAPWLNPTP